MTQKIEISSRTIFLTLAIIIFLLALYLIRDLIIVLFVSFVLFVALNPLVERLVRLNFPRPLGVFLVVLIITLIFALLVAAFLIPFINQFNSLVEKLTDIIGELRPLEFIDRTTLENSLRNFSGAVINFIFSLLGNFLAVVSVIIFTIYLLLARDKYERLIAYLDQKGYRWAPLFEKIEGRLGAWVRAQFWISVAIGVLYFLALVAIAIGDRLLGFGGVLLAVPVTVVIQIVLEDYLTQGKGGFPFWRRA